MKGFITTTILVMAGIAVVVGLFGGVIYLKQQDKVGGYVLTVPQGGTGASSLSNYPIVGAGSTGALTASSTLWTAGLNATSTTASSTFQGVIVESLEVNNGFLQDTFATCSGTANKVVYSTVTGKFSCATDETGVAGALIDWQKDLNFGVLTLTPTTSIPIWAKDMIYGSSTLIVSGAGASTFAGAVGIGTTTPNWNLSVAGVGSFDNYARASYFTATSTTATSTFAGAIQMGTPTTTSAITFNDGRRMDFYSDDLWTYETGHQADRIRFYNLTDTAKSAITFYDATTTTPVAVTAIVTHDLLGAGNEHKHISIETVDDSFDSLDSRFECNYGVADNTSNAYCGVASGWDLRVGSGGNLNLVDGNFTGGGVFDIYPNYDLGNTTIGLRFSTSTNANLVLNALGVTDSLEIVDNVRLNLNSGLFWIDSQATADYASVFRLTGESGEGYQGGFMQYDAAGNEFIIGSHDSADTLTANDKEVLRIARDGTLAFFPTAKVGIGTTTPYAKLSVVGETVSSYFTATSTTASSIFQGSLIVQGAATTSDLWVNGTFAIPWASTTGPGLYQEIIWGGATTSQVRFVLSGNTNIEMNSTSSKPVDGGRYITKFCQDATGGRTLTWINPVGIRWSDGTTTISSTANSCSYIGWIYDSLYRRYAGIASSTGVMER